MQEEEITRMPEKTPSGQNNQQRTDMEAEYVPLPSQGLFYKGSFKGLDKLLVRKLDWTDEDILTTKSYYENGTLFDVLLKRVIVDDCGFNAMDLVPVDRDDILWLLRIGAFGTEYIIPIKCKNKLENEIPVRLCGNVIKLVWNLGEFEMPNPPEQYLNELQEIGGIVITLPQTQGKCKITVPSIGRIKEINKSYANKKSKERLTQDFNNTIRLLSVIEEIYDEENKPIRDRERIYQWLMKSNKGKPLPMLDSRYIIKKANEIDFRVDTRQNIVCPECGHIEEGVGMPMSIQFFWPEFEELSGISNAID
jgi:hypothetical protein